MTHVPSHQIHHRGRRAAALVAAAAGLAMTGGLAAVPAQAAPAAFSFGTPVGSSYVDTASTADNPACANVLLVGVRESGAPAADAENTGMGAGGPIVLNQLASHISPNLTGRSVWLQYPALGMDQLWADAGMPDPSTVTTATFLGDLLSLVFTGTSFNQKPYLQGEAQGVTELNKVLQDSATRCPAEKWVLYGASQGALVIHSSLDDEAQLATPDRLAAALLIGDPARQSSTTEQRGSALEPLHGGIIPVVHAIAPRLVDAVPQLPAQVQPYVLELCDDGDAIADTSSMITGTWAGNTYRWYSPTEALTVHSSYTDPDSSVNTLTNANREELMRDISTRVDAITGATQLTVTASAPMWITKTLRVKDGSGNAATIMGVGAKPSGISKLKLTSSGTLKVLALRTGTFQIPVMYRVHVAANNPDNYLDQMTVPATLTLHVTI